MHTIDPSRQTWLQRQRRTAQWNALKQLWQAQKSVRQAKDANERLKAIQGEAKVRWLYQHELRRAIPMWQKVQRAIKSGHVYDLTY